MTEHDDRDGGAEIIQFPNSHVQPDRAPTTVERASLVEAGRRDERSRILEPRLNSSIVMKEEDRFVLARNLRDLVNALEQAGKLDPKELAYAIFGRRQKKAMQEYLLPDEVEDMATFRVDYPTRSLARKPRRYHEIALKAAEMTKTDDRQVRVDLARGSSFWPGAEDIADEERRAASEVAEVLRLVRRRLDAVFPLQRYFDLTERYRVLPAQEEDGLVMKPAYDFSSWAHASIPSFRLATRWLYPPQEVVVVVSDRSGGKRLYDADFDRIYGAGAFSEATVARRRVFSLGTGRLTGGIGPVGILSHEIVLPDGPDYKIVRQASPDRFGPGWNRIDVEIGGQVWQGAWQLMEALRDPPDEEDMMDGDQPPDVDIVPITADWLLNTKESGWMIARSGGWLTPNPWSILANLGTSRLGDEDTLPAIIERALLAEQEKHGAIKGIADRYEQCAAALRNWLVRLDDKNRARLETVAARLSGGPGLVEDHLAHTQE